MRRVLLIAAVAAGALFGASQASGFQFVYAGGFSDGDVGIGARVNGGLAERSYSPFDTGASGLEGIAMSPDRRNFFAVDSAGELRAFRVNSRARMTESPGSPQLTGFSAYGVAATTNGKFVYATSGLPSAVLGFSVAGNGAIAPTAQGEVPAPAPTGLAATPNGKYLYVATETVGGAVYGFRIRRNGALRELASSPTPGPGDAFALAIAPNGKTLYAGNRADETINAFAIAGDGALTELADSPYPAGGGNPFSVTVSPNGENVYAGLYDDSKVAVFDVGGHGSLTPQAGSPYPGAPSVTALALDPLGQYLYEQSAGAPIRIVPIDGDGTPGAPTAFTFANHGDFQSIVTAPDQPPRAKFKVAGHLATHEQISFNAKASQSKNGIEYAWKFGDGSSDDTFRDKVKHAYREPGKYEVKLTLTTQDGCSTRYVSAGVTPYCNGGKRARATATIKVGK